jgi:hypothetical protein
MAAKAKDMKPFPLENTLRDLALLRVSEIDMEELLPRATVNGKEGSVVGESYELVREARKALKIQHGGGVGRQGEKVEEVRNEIEELLEGVGGHFFNDNNNNNNKY